MIGHSSEEPAGEAAEERVEELFDRALRLPPKQRSAFLRAVCGEDGALRRELESLLRADAEAGGFLPELAEEPSQEPVLAGEIARGRRLGPYRLHEKLGEGGMGTVFLAMRDDDQYRRRVAIKLLPITMATPDHLRRFRTERHILASLDHPNIARLYDAGATAEGLPYCVLEYIEGEPLDVYCDRHRLPVKERLRLFRTVCWAVHFAHQNLVVHRDLKPANILVTAEGTPKLLDFGIAKLLNPELAASSSQPTLTWHRVLTPSYASPEQFQGRMITTASDVYSLGVVLYQLLCGRLPLSVEDKTPREIEQELCTRQPPKVSQAVISPVAPEAEATPGAEREATGTGQPSPEEVARRRRLRPQQLRKLLSGDLDTIVAKALRKEPQRRYGSAGELAEDLQRYLQGLPVRARKDTLIYRAGKRLRRHRFAAAAAALVLAVICSLSVLLFVQSQRAELARERAESVATFLEEIFQVADPTGSTSRETSARELLDRGARRIPRQLQDQPELQAALMNTIGNAYLGLGLYAEASPFLESALARRRELLGEDHPSTAETLNDLGVLAVQRRDVERAEELLRQALELRRRLTGETGPATAESTHHLAALLSIKGEYERAEELFRRALDLRRALTGPEDLEVAETLNGLGVVLRLRGKYGQAEQALTRGLEIRRRILGGEHYRIAESLNDLGTLYNEIEDFERAEPLFLEALDIARRLFGEDNLPVAALLHNLGFLHQEQGHLEDAERFYRRSLEVKEALFSEHHERVLSSLGNLAALLDAKGEHGPAEELHRRVLELERRAFEVDTPYRAILLENLATNLRLQGRFEQAEVLQRQSLALRQRLLRPDHPDIPRGLNNLGVLLAQKGELPEAEQTLRRAVELRQRLLGPDHPHTRRSEGHLRELLRKVEESSEVDNPAAD
ncbi:MAG: serine/threonine-protein kinase [Acidobacteriota bacterium]|nr:serine/threonine-protein kinase [Acidobacteriota bacterium]